MDFKNFRNPKMILKIFVIPIPFCNGFQTIEVQVIRFDCLAILTFKELETLNSQSTQRLKTNLGNMAMKKIWRLLNSELLKAIFSKDPWLKGLVLPNIDTTTKRN